ncbi:caspase family protein [Membranihabitans maritimus]|uniref:caspase family protein n=1 Tax=Membranihabitans maritimus TaxID=2904244 RepID=UPI001F2BB6F4|nr:caspase family protein [Membranihabitans maritimus]
MRGYFFTLAILLPAITIGQCIQGDCKSGLGAYKFENGSIYQGYFFKEKPHGKGKYVYSNGNVYKGEWKHGKKSGEGEIKYDNGARYNGEFLNNYMHGSGIYYFSNGDKFQGIFKNDRPNGYGVLTKSDGKIVSGNWIEGKLTPTQEEQIPSQPPSSGNVEIYAVIVGVSRYEKFKTLKYSDDDAYRIYAFFKSPEGGAIPDKNIRILIDESANKENIQNALDEITEKADENDVIICYFAGHGLDGYYLPVDSDGYRHKISYYSIKQQLETSKAKQKLFMADACYSGSLLASRTLDISALDHFYNKLGQGEGSTAFLLSSKKEEFSKESSGLRQGIFSHYLIKGLQGEADFDRDQIVSIQELYDYIKVEVSNYTGKEQNPVLAGSYQPDLPVSWVRE